MRKTALLLASFSALLLYTTPASAQAATEAGMLTGAVAGITSATSHKLGVSNLGNKAGGKITEVTNTTTAHRTTHRQTKSAVTHKKSAPTTTASTATHPTKPQSHIVSVWPPNALNQSQPQTQPQ